ncbi:MAG TPA: hypothetical protein VME20_03455 [Acidimicrobiales bacterium]|nr:hypothetical protein [Acidimicrobiales bacterium]
MSGSVVPQGIDLQGDSSSECLRAGLLPHTLRGATGSPRSDAGSARGTAWLAADTKRLKETTAIGLDEYLFVRAGFTNFENFRIRALLYAGKPNFRVLDSIVVT